MSKKEERRFTKTDFSEATPVRWGPQHALYAGGFKCSRHEFKPTFLRRIPKDSASHVGLCWVLIDNDNLAAYITLCTDRLQATGDHGSSQRFLKSEGIPYRTLPAVKIGFLAADKRAKGAGTRLVEWAMYYIAETIAPSVGVRFVTVDALYDNDVFPPYDTSSYYEHLGFESANSTEEMPPQDGYRTMFFDLKDLIESIHGVTVVPSMA